MTALAVAAARPPRHALRPLLSTAVSAPPQVQVAVRMHRECAPEHASLVRSACMQDRSVLPRWHQDDRGRANEHRGVHVVAPAGSYARVPAWLSREHWVTYVVPLAIAQHRDVLIKHHVSPTMLREWAKVKSGYADPRTGRRCIVRPKTLASVLGVDERHVQNINRAARELGLEHVVLVGRMLNQDECMGARRRGSRQRGLSTEVALTVPTFLRRSVDSFTPTSGPATPHKSQGRRVPPHGLAAEQKGSAPPTHLNKGLQRTRRGRQLAADVARKVPWLAEERPGRLAPALMRFAVAGQPWTAQDVADAIGAHTLRTGRGAIQADSIRTRPAAVLAAILRELDVEADHPGLVPFETVEAEPAETCGRTGCDHGWIEDHNGRVRPCPHCPSSVRAQLADDWDPPALDEHGDPPF